MKRLLLFLICVLTLFGVSQAAEPITKPITFSSANKVTDNPLEISFAKNNGTTAPTYNGGIRLYYDSSKAGNGGSMTISKSETATTNIAIKKVVIYYTGTSYTYPSNAVTVGTLSTSGTTGTWEAPQGQNINSIEFKNTNTSNNQVRFTKIDITYEEIASEPDPTDPEPGVEEKYVLVKSVNDIITGGEYVLVATYGGDNYIMTSTNSNNKFTSEKVNISNETVTIDSNTSPLVLSPINIATSGNNITCIWSNDTQYLGSNSNNGTNLNLLASTSNQNYYSSTVSISNNLVSIVFSIATGRCVMLNTTSNNVFGYYSTTNTSGYYKPALYKKVVPEGPKVPALPVVTIDGETLDNNGSKTVLAGTEVSYECENSTTITATFNGKEITDNPFIIEENGELVIYGTNEEGGDGPEFTYTFKVDVKNEFKVVGSNFRQMLNNSNYKDNIEEGYYVIGRYFNSESNTVMVAMSVNEGSNNIPSTQNVEFTKLNSSIYVAGNSDCEVLTPTDDDVLIVYLEKNEQDQWSIRTVNYGDGFKSSQKYLSAPDNEATTLTLVDEFTPTYIDITNQNNANISYKAEDFSRTIKLSGSSFSYQKSGGVVQLYKYFDQQLFKPEVADVKLRLTENETSTLPTYENAPELSYSIAQEGEVISISDGEIKAMNAGEAIVTVSWNESDDWFAGSTTFNVTVLPPMVDITETFGFRYPSVRGKKDVGVVSQAVYYEGDGKVEYSIWEYKFADPADKTLISSTDVTIQDDGMIRPEDIQNAVINKVYTVKANVAATDLYSAGEAFYTFVIEAPVEASKGNLIEDFTINNENRWNDANGNDCKLSGSYVDDEFTLTSNTTGIKYNIYKGVYQNNVYQFAKSPLGYISFTIPSNCQSITIGWGGNSSTKAPGSLTVSIDGKDVETFEFYEDKTIDVRTKGGSTMTIINANSDYVIRMSNLIFEIPTSGVPEAGLYFDVSGDGVEHYINVFEDETIELPDLIGAEGMDFKDLIFDIDEIDEADDAETYQGYTITAKDFDDISIDINYPGVYTFRAEYNAEKLVELGELDKVENAKFLDGFAILRLNVFPRLTVVPSDNHDSTLADDERTNAPELTLVQTVEEDGEETAVINLPSIEALENSFKYSTIKIVKVEIKRGTESITYEGDELANLDPEIKFTEDGYVKYTVRYANTEDFQAESTVHVVLMPKTTIDRSEDNKITLTPSKNAKLKYAYVYGNGKKEIKRRATDIPNDDWEEADGNHEIDDVESLKNDGVTAIFYKTEKDLSNNQDMVDNKAVPTNSILADEGTIVLATVPVELNIGTIEEQPFKTDTHTYTLSGIINFNNSNLEVGKDFTVTVTPKDNAKGWASTEVTGNELNEAYQAAFANIQGEETGLYDQYTLITKNNGLVDGFYTGVTNLNVTEGTEENSFTISADLPCSGVYVVTVAPVDGSEFTFDEVEKDFSVTPNFMGVFGEEQGFNIEGFGAQDKFIQIGEDFIKDNLKDGKLKDFICYIPGTYFADSFTVEVINPVNGNDSESGIANGVKRHATNNDGSADASKYFSAVSMPNFYQNGEVNDQASYDVEVTVTKNNATSTKQYTVRIGTPYNSSTGVDEIEAVEAEAEYFNLQGLKIKNPERGQIYIKVVGNKATKVIM